MQKPRSLTVTLPETAEHIQALNVLLARTNREDPDPADVRKLREILKHTPEVWKQAGNLAALARERIAAYASSQPLVQESIFRVADEIRGSLTLPTDTPIEHLVVEQCVTAYLLHYTIEHRYINAHEQDMSVEDAMFWEKRLTASQHRFLRAVETLSRLRRFARPLMQINIGENQTNIAANPPGGMSPAPRSGPAPLSANSKRASTAVRRKSQR